MRDAASTFDWIGLIPAWAYTLGLVAVAALCLVLAQLGISACASALRFCWRVVRRRRRLAVFRSRNKEGHS